METAPADFQGDLVDPLTGERRYRRAAWWEGAVAPVVPVVLDEPPPPADPVVVGYWDNGWGYVAAADLPPGAG
jgi:hypothetical protein